MRNNQRKNAQLHIDSKSFGVSGQSQLVVGCCDLVGGNVGRQRGHWSSVKTVENQDTKICGGSVQEAAGLTLLHNCYCCTIVSSPGCRCSLFLSLGSNKHKAAWIQMLTAQTSWKATLTVSRTLEALHVIIPADRVSNRLRKRVHMWHRIRLPVWVKKPKQSTASRTSGELSVWIGCQLLLFENSTKGSLYTCIKAYIKIV